MNNFCIGIDPSYTNTGIVVIDDNNKIVYQDCIASALSEKGLQAKRAADFMLTAIEAFQYISNQLGDTSIYICIEYPMVRFQKAPNAVKVNEAFAVIACAAKLVFNKNISICYSHQWKSFIGAKHKAKMKIVSQFINDKYHVEFANFDLYAAYGIALYLRGKIQREGD